MFILWVKFNHQTCLLIFIYLILNFKFLMPNIFSKMNSNLNFNLSVVIDDIIPFVHINDYRLRDLGSGESINVKRCNNRQCKEFCPRFILSDFVYSASIDRYFPCVNLEYPKVINCKSQNLIYLITCSKCLLQYVGQTCSVISVRFCMHRACMSGKKYASSCKRLCDHFSSGPCKGAEHFVQVIENWEGDGHLPNRGGEDQDLTRKRKKQEDHWMLKLRTIYPYGLNDSLNEPLKGVLDYSIGLNFPPLPRKYTRPNQRVFNHSKMQRSSEIFIVKLRHLLVHKIDEAAKLIRVSLANMRKKELKALGGYIRGSVSEEEMELYSIWFKMILDIIKTKIYKPPPVRPKRKVPKYKINIPFVNKAMDFINLPQIIRSKEAKDSMPSILTDDDIPMIVYSLSQPIRSRILNYKKFVSELDLDVFCKNNDSINCCCSQYDDKFLNKDRNHILTGNLQIVKNNKLRKLFSKGPKFREPAKINFVSAKESIKSGIEDFIKNISETKKKGIYIFEHWKYSLLELVDSKIDKYTDKIKSKSIKSVFNDPDAKAELKRLKENFVIVPIDKAANNISFICKQHYASVIVSELKYNPDLSKNMNSTYEHVSELSSADIINSHRTVLSENGHQMKEGMDCLPNMYWTPKMHKSPVGERFIIASPKCSLKPLLKDATSILKLFQKQIQSYHDQERIWKGVSNFWVILNNQPVIDRISKINAKKKAVSIRTFDFSTLYTKIPHNLLKAALTEIIEFVFKGGISNGVYVSKYGSVWRKPSVDSTLYTKEKIISLFELIIDNAFFQVGNKIFRQIIGIPMGSDPAPFIANLFLYIYENKFMENLKKTDLKRAKNLRHVFRFIDDLIALNDDDEFLRSYKEIYPKEMELKVENNEINAASFLDLGFQVEDRIFKSNLYDKREAFQFSVIRMPNKSSNMPYKMFYSTISAEILRICRATSHYPSFINSVRKLIIKMRKQGAQTRGISKFVTKMMLRHWDPFRKFALSPEKKASDVSSIV